MPLRALLFLALALALAGCARASAPVPTPRPISAADTTRPTAALVPPGAAPSLSTAGFAKVLCSAVFVSGRERTETVRNVDKFDLPAPERVITDTVIDYERKEVRLTYLNTFTRTARFYGDQGCIIHPEGFDRVFFEPVPVVSSLPDPATQDWPMGDRLRDAPLPPGVNAARLAAAVDSAFADPEALTAALVVVHRGRIIAERYGAGAHRDMQLESWSMGKSLTATLFARLVQDGLFHLDQPAPVEEWHDRPGDPRSRIRIRDLLQMSSGLHFVAPRDPDYTPAMGYPDHMYIYSGAVNSFEHSITRPLQFQPGTEGRYRNSDPLTIGHLIREAVEARGESYHTFPQRELFDRIGIRRQVLETDPYGNFLLTGYDYGTPRNWARLGLLYLQDGVWMGERLLPEGWAEFVSKPAPAWKEPVYGGQFWVNGTGEWNLPREAYYMAGAGGQYTFVVPSHDLVVVRMGHFRGGRAGARTLNAALAELMKAIPVARRAS
jgi:CubicO group peptidase (beta-lactamase class C family)